MTGSELAELGAYPFHPTRRKFLPGVLFEGNWAGGSAPVWDGRRAGTGGV